MLLQRTDRRTLLTMGAMALLAGCKVIPASAPAAPPPPVEQPSASTLPADGQRHRIALIVPLSGPNAAVGQSIANATTMALLDTNAQNLRITTYDSAAGAAGAAARALADGNRLILGPLDPGDVRAVSLAARAAHVPIIAYANDSAVASGDVFLMGTQPGQSISRTVSYAAGRGSRSYAALVPEGSYGPLAEQALEAASQRGGGRFAGVETYNRGNTSIISAARRLKVAGAFDTVLIADSARMAASAAPVLRGAGAARPLVIGTELWSGDSLLASSPALRGALFAAVSDTRFRQFADSYKGRFGSAPYRVATMGYDSVLLTLRIARDWKPGTTFPSSRLGDRGGFLGLDGPFRFGTGGMIERALEVREARAGTVAVVSPAPARFED